MLLQKISDNYLWVLILILAVNLSQRKARSRGQQKRMATLIVAVLALVLQVSITLILSRSWPQWLFFVALAITIGLGILMRKRLCLFTLKCVACKKPLKIGQILNNDDNLCDACYQKEHPELADEIIETTFEQFEQFDEATLVEQIDWDLWEPSETAVLCYLVSKERVLLIHKKRGLGAGLINAPGGHIEPEETAREAAIRETLEETGILVTDPQLRGQLEFQFRDGLAMRGYVFFATEYSGTPIETDEAKPFWVALEEIPYDKMWSDDLLWLPRALAGEHFHGRFIFDDQELIDSEIEFLER